MERTIDRTSYRRSARNGANSNSKSVDKEIENHSNNKKFKVKNMILNQIIVSLLIIIGILIAKYYDMTNVFEWIERNMSNGYSMNEIYLLAKNNFFKNGFNLYAALSSGDNMSGEGNAELVIFNNNIESGDKFISGETSGEYISAVEGINQMSEDVNMIKTKYSMQAPLKGIITSHFGSRVSNNPIVSSYHTGLDIAANSGTEIYASHSGKVIMANQYSSYGNCVMIESENLVTVYAHCSSIEIKENQYVNAGDIIAKVGMTGNATGPHLHFEIRYEGRFVDPELIFENGLE